MRGTAEKNGSLKQFATDLFKIWDEGKQGRIKVKKIVKHFMALGLAPSDAALYKVIAVIKECDDKQVQEMTFSLGELQKILVL
jgi:Ca2+-binding EF-hand superfamily protein